jgi:hypothetical protein
MVKKPLAKYMREQSTWRRDKATEYPEDATRNLRSADALEVFACYIETLDAEGVELTWMRDHCDFTDGVFSPRDDSRQMIARHGFARHPIPPEEFMAELGGSEAKARTAERMECFNETLGGMKPISCLRGCAAKPEMTLDTARFLINVANDADNGRRQEENVFRFIAVTSCLDHGWGVPVDPDEARDDDDDAMVVCPQCATADEITKAREIQEFIVLTAPSMVSTN